MTVYGFATQRANTSAANTLALKQWPENETIARINDNG